MFLSISLKWKLSISFCLLSLGLVVSYVLMASKTFESDKISYVIDFSELQLESVAHQINDRLDRILFDAKSILAALQIQTHSLSPLGLKYFEELNDIKSIHIWHEGENNPIFEIAKKEFILKNKLIEPWSIAKNKNIEDDTKDDVTRIFRIQNGDFVLYRISLKVTGNGPNDSLWIDILSELSDFLPKQTGQRSLVLSQRELNLESQNLKNLDASKISYLLQDLFLERGNKSSFFKIGDSDYLVSIAHLKYDNLSLVYLENKDSALGALKLLFNRSLIFLLLSAFSILFLAVIISGALTRDLDILKDAAIKVGSGDLDYIIKVTSRDEIGTLAQNFQQMTRKIKVLLSDTEEKARMQAELNTAGWVQESLFPENRNHVHHNIRFAGHHLTSSECSGDWWHYFQRNDDLFVVIGDATGHGSGAALITAVSRSLFSQIEVSNHDIETMCVDWNRAILKCSRKKC